MDPWVGDVVAWMCSILLLLGLALCVAGVTGVVAANDRRVERQIRRRRRDWPL